jgi:hypothetical protein
MNTDVCPPGPPVGTTFKPGTVASASGTVRYCWVAMSCAVITVTELGVCALEVTVPVGLTTAGAAGPPADGPGAGAAASPGLGFGTRVRAIRRGFLVSAGCIALGGAGTFTVTGGSRSGEADCCALAGEIAANASGTRTVEASKQARCRWAAPERKDIG